MTYFCLFTRLIKISAFNGLLQNWHLHLYLILKMFDKRNLEKSLKANLARAHRCRRLRRFFSLWAKLLKMKCFVFVKVKLVYYVSQVGWGKSQVLKFYPKKVENSILNYDSAQRTAWILRLRSLRQIGSRQRFLKTIC